MLTIWFVWEAQLLRVCAKIASIKHSHDKYVQVKNIMKPFLVKFASIIDNVKKQTIWLLVALKRQLSTSVS